MPAEIKELLDSIRGASMRSPNDHDEFGALVSTTCTARGHVACFVPAIMLRHLCEFLQRH